MTEKFEDKNAVILKKHASIAIGSKKLDAWIVPNNDTGSKEQRDILLTIIKFCVSLGLPILSLIFTAIYVTYGIIYSRTFSHVTI